MRKPSIFGPSSTERYAGLSPNYNGPKVAEVGADGFVVDQHGGVGAAADQLQAGVQA